MKNIFKLFYLVMTLSVILGAFGACNSSSPTRPTEPTEPSVSPEAEGSTEKTTLSSPEDDSSITVKWYEGSSLIKTEQIEKGSRVSAWTPVNVYGEFKGWYSDASY